MWLKHHRRLDAPKFIFSILKEISLERWKSRELSWASRQRAAFFAALKACSWSSCCLNNNVFWQNSFCISKPHLGSTRARVPMSLYKRLRPKKIKSKYYSKKLEKFNQKWYFFVILPRQKINIGTQKFTFDNSIPQWETYVYVLWCLKMPREKINQGFFSNLFVYLFVCHVGHTLCIAKNGFKGSPLVEVT